MKKYLVCLLMLSFFTLAVTSAAAAPDMVRVGLAYGSGALPSANLENNVGSGYRFGYYNTNGSFVTLGSTTQTQISMLKTQNIYLKSDLYYASDPGGSTAVIGCYHLQLPQSYASFEAAQATAQGYSDAFPAWISGQYYVRVGAYASKSDAQAAQASVPGSSIAGTSSGGISITRTKSADILFQVDGLDGNTLAVNPNLSDSVKAVTWFKGYRYYGSFMYERIDGGSLTVSNYLSMDDYIKGILPYEMSASWPQEALKAQAVCARNYTLTGTGSRHKNQHFDICNTTCCQVYQGMNKATAESDRAVDATSGVCAYYQGKPAQTFYYSCDGGATEDVKNVWGSDYPYLAGVVDPYEAAVESKIQGYRWTVSFTADKLTSILQGKGYACSTIVDLKVTEYTPMGNVLSITFTDSNGKQFSFTRERARTILGLKSQRYQINGAGGGATTGEGYYVDESGKMHSGLAGLWSTSADGQSQLSSGTLYAITAAGTEALQGRTASTASNTNSNGLFTVTGTGNGHLVGMSQWGAYAMAQQGLSYQDILKFYFKGIEVY